eukprot:COSAG06_NODE_49313_length_326_cov_0.876652_1_plen_68_part_10
MFMVRRRASQIVALCLGTLQIDSRLDLSGRAVPDTGDDCLGSGRILWVGSLQEGGAPEPLTIERGCRT